MNLDWSRMKAVVLESDDWGLCAWSPDEQAFRVLADAPEFRGATGRRYGGSTLESAADVKELSDLLLEFRGGDGFPPVWQANTVMASPDWARLAPPGFECASLPLIDYPSAPGRWARPGLWGEVTRAREAGVWWPELHGLHHLPETAWLTALRRGDDDARRAFEQQSPVCRAVAESGEYDASEPLELRRHNLDGAVRRFRTLFGRGPDSFCPPDYRWDDAVEACALELGVTAFQGRAERTHGVLPHVRHFLARFCFPDLEGDRFYLPPRIAFEPGAAGEGAARLGVDAAHRGIRAAWALRQPAIVSSHRTNFVQVDAARGAAGRERLRELITRLVDEGATFLTDAELRSLIVRGWSVRSIGSRGALVRNRRAAGEALRFPAAAGAERVSIREGRAAGASAALANGEVVLHCDVGEVLVEWRRA
ncbi:MAG: hypothetical protein HYR73_09140 [Candidatus Eisenbacteria bacterium]|nr:hypothetical protein [Candidatus Eisenbacteria bacterium]